MDPNKDYYAIMGVDKNASKDDIKKAFRKLTIKYHPDKSSEPDAEERFKEISEANDILSDNEKRKNYDYLRENPHGSLHDINMENIMRDFFGSMRGDFFHREKEETILNIEITVQAPLSDVYKGFSKDIVYDRKITCQTCSGDGGKSKGVSKCIKCNGHGKIVARRGSGGVIFSQVMFCDICAGKGETISNPCQTCDGQGNTMQSNLIKLEYDRTKKNYIVFSRQGHNLENKTGDVIVRISFVQDPNYMIIRNNDQFSVCQTIDVSVNDISNKEYIEAHTPDGSELKLNTKDFKNMASVKVNSDMFLFAHGWIMPKMGINGGDYYIISNLSV